MARIELTDTKTVSPEAESILKEIEGAFGMIPNLFKTYAFFPPLLEANWNKVKAVMMQGKLSRKTKEAIAVLVSQDNGCSYCIGAHTAALKSIGVSDTEIDTIKKELEKAEFNEKEKLLIQFARRANLEPLKIKNSEFEKLLRAEISFEEIVEALGVMEVFTAFNKFLDALQVDIDFK